MAPANAAAHELERPGVRTFSAEEMAFEYTWPYASEGRGRVQYLHLRGSQLKLGPKTGRRRGQTRNSRRREA